MHSLHLTGLELTEIEERLFRNPNKMTLFAYQKQARIYLDEYPEQKKLREEYFKDDTYFINRWLKRN